MKFYNLILILFKVHFCLLLFYVDKVKGIVGGQDVEEGQFTYHAAIQANNKYRCGAAIVSDRHVMSAAHCFLDKEGKFENHQFSVLMGSMNMLSQDPRKLVIDVEKIYIPRMYNITLPPLAHDGDISISKLARQLQLSTENRLSKLELPAYSLTNSLYNNKEAIVTGFGATRVKKIRSAEGTVYEPEPSGKLLKYAVTKVIPIHKCRELYEVIYSEDVSVNAVCARIKGTTAASPKGVCRGDSGGPLVFNGNIIIAVAVATQKRCSETLAPAIYTSVTLSIPFIHQAMQDVPPSSDIRIAEYEEKSYFGWLGKRKILKEI